MQVVTGEQTAEISARQQQQALRGDNSRPHEAITAGPARR